MRPFAPVASPVASVPTMSTLGVNYSPASLVSRVSSLVGGWKRQLGTCWMQEGSGGGGVRRGLCSFGSLAPTFSASAGLLRLMPGCAVLHVLTTSARLYPHSSFLTGKPVGRLRSAVKCMALSTGTSGVQPAAGRRPASASWTEPVPPAPPLCSLP